MYNQKYLYYLGEFSKIILNNKSLDADYVFEMWKPAINKIAPRGASKSLFKLCCIWWILHYLKIFPNPNYSIALIYHKETGDLAHYSVVLPRYFRVAFMKKNDLQIGPIGTSEQHQRRGLASFAIQKIVKTYHKPEVNFWYIVRQENIPSIKCIEKFSFFAFGEGGKAGLFHKYKIREIY